MLWCVNMHWEDISFPSKPRGICAAVCFCVNRDHHKLFHVHPKYQDLSGWHLWCDWEQRSSCVPPRLHKYGNVLGWAFLCHCWSLFKFHFLDPRYLYMLNIFSISALSYLRLNHTRVLRLRGLILFFLRPVSQHLLTDTDGKIRFSQWFSFRSPC